MVGSEWGPRKPRVRLQAGRRESQVWPSPAFLGLVEALSIAKSIDLGEKGMIPLEVRFHHNPDSTHGFVGPSLPA
jgi:hypothetical protein